MWLPLVILCFTLSLGLHAIATRLWPRTNDVLSYAAVALSAGLVLVLALFEVYGPDVRTWAALCLYALTAEFYVFLFTMIGSSITARILTVLRRRVMTQVEMDAAFPTSGMVEDRVHNLLHNGFIRVDSDSTFRLTPRGWLLVRCFRPLRRFFRRGQPIY
jgi:hypothetical protein